MKWVGSAAVVLALGGCASAHAGGAPVRTQAAAASCAGTAAQAMRGAPTVFIAIALDGPARAVAGADALSSPARMQVLRWIRGGHGPAIARVQTAISATGRVSEDGIVPHPGERWRIVSTARRSPYTTSACLGSVRLAPLVRRAPIGPPS